MFSKAGVITFTAIICVTALGITAMCKGIDSGLLTGIVASISGLGGYGVKWLIDLRHKSKESHPKGD